MSNFLMERFIPVDDLAVFQDRITAGIPASVRETAFSLELAGELWEAESAIINSQRAIDISGALLNMARGNRLSLQNLFDGKLSQELGLMTTEMATQMVLAIVRIGVYSAFRYSPGFSDELMKDAYRQYIPRNFVEHTLRTINLSEE